MISFPLYLAHQKLDAGRSGFVPLPGGERIQERVKDAAAPALCLSPTPGREDLTPHALGELLFHILAYRPYRGKTLSMLREKERFRKRESENAGL